MQRLLVGAVPVIGAKSLRQSASSRKAKQDFQCPSVYHTLPPFSVTTASATGRYGSRSRTVLVLAPDISTTLNPCSRAALSIAIAFVEMYPFWPVLEIGRASTSDCRPYITMIVIVTIVTVYIHRRGVQRILIPVELWKANPPERRQSNSTDERKTQLGT
jgi:hypothetical protein